MRLRFTGFSRAGFVCLWRSARGSRFFDRCGASAGVSASDTGASGAAAVSAAAASGTGVSFWVSSVAISLLLHGQDPCDLAPLELQLRRVLELPGRRLEAEVEELLARVGEARVELVVREVAQVLS